MNTYRLWIGNIGPGADGEQYSFTVKAQDHFEAERMCNLSPNEFISSWEIL